MRETWKFSIILVISLVLLCHLWIFAFCDLKMLLGVYVSRTYSRWLDPFIIMKPSSLSLIKFPVLECSLSDNIIASTAFFLWLHGNFFSFLLVSNYLYANFYVVWISKFFLDQAFLGKRNPKYLAHCSRFSSSPKDWIQISLLIC